VARFATLKNTAYPVHSDSIAEGNRCEKGQSTIPTSQKRVLHASYSARSRW